MFPLLFPGWLILICRELVCSVNGQMRRLQYIFFFCCCFAICFLSAGQTPALSNGPCSRTCIQRPPLLPPRSAQSLSQMPVLGMCSYGCWCKHPAGVPLWAAPRDERGPVSPHGWERVALGQGDQGWGSPGTRGNP